MGPFGRDFGSEYDREFGRRDWGEAPGRWGYTGGARHDFDPMRGSPRYDRGFRELGARYDAGYRTQGDPHLRDPFPVRPSHSTGPMVHGGRGRGYDHGYFGIDYDRDMRAGGRFGSEGFGNDDWRARGPSRARGGYDRNFGDFRNSYFAPWF